MLLINPDMIKIMNNKKIFRIIILKENQSQEEGKNKEHKLMNIYKKDG